MGRADFTRFALAETWGDVLQQEVRVCGGKKHWRLVDVRSTVVRRMMEELKRKRKAASLQAAAPSGASISTYGQHKMRKLIKDMLAFL